MTKISLENSLSGVIIVSRGNNNPKSLYELYFHDRTFLQRKYVHTHTQSLQTQIRDARTAHKKVSSTPGIVSPEILTIMEISIGTSDPVNARRTDTFPRLFLFLSLTLFVGKFLFPYSLKDS